MNPLTKKEIYRLIFEGNMVEFLIKNGIKVQTYPSNKQIKTYYVRYDNDIGYAGLIRDKEDFNVIKNLPLPLYTINTR
uniref:Uncharacterized protein n=1 Tax=viral metagenome TaxID=1070528 RepID=A0A6C0J7P3_9ZZZZ